MPVEFGNKMTAYLSIIWPVISLTITMNHAMQKINYQSEMGNLSRSVNGPICPDIFLDDHSPLETHWCNDSRPKNTLHIFYYPQMSNKWWWNGRLQGNHHRGNLSQSSGCRDKFANSLCSHLPLIWFRGTSGITDLRPGGRFRLITGHLTLSSCLFLV
jgi:hypothetical protein